MGKKGNGKGRKLLEEGSPEIKDEEADSGDIDDYEDGTHDASMSSDFAATTLCDRFKSKNHNYVVDKVDDEDEDVDFGSSPRPKKKAKGGGRAKRQLPDAMMVNPEVGATNYLSDPATPTKNMGPVEDLENPSPLAAGGYFYAKATANDVNLENPVNDFTAYNGLDDDNNLHFDASNNTFPSNEFHAHGQSQYPFAQPYPQQEHPYPVQNMGGGQAYCADDNTPMVEDGQFDYDFKHTYPEL